MPGRLWGWIAAILAALAVAVVALVVFAPGPAQETETAAPANEAAGVEPSAALPAAPAGAGEPPRIPGPPAPTPEPPPVDPALEADLAAYAAAGEFDVPRGGGVARFTDAEAIRGTLRFIYEVDLDPEGLEGPDDPIGILPAVDAFACGDGGVCLSFTDDLARATCESGALAPLLARGAKIVYLYRGPVGVEIATETVTEASCPG